MWINGAAALIPQRGQKTGISPEVEVDCCNPAIWRHGYQPLPFEILVFDISAVQPQRKEFKTSIVYSSH